MPAPPGNQQLNRLYSSCDIIQVPVPVLRNRGVYPGTRIQIFSSLIPNKKMSVFLTHTKIVTVLSNWNWDNLDYDEKR